MSANHVAFERPIDARDRSMLTKGVRVVAEVTRRCPDDPFPSTPTMYAGSIGDQTTTRSGEVMVSTKFVEHSKQLVCCYFRCFSIEGLLIMFLMPKST